MPDETNTGSPLSELAKLYQAQLTVDKALRDRAPESARIDLAEARRILYGMLTPTDARPFRYAAIGEATNAVVDAIIDSLPKEMITSTALSAIDIRPYLSVAASDAAKPFWVQTFQANADGSAKENPDFNPVEVARTGLTGLLEDYTTRQVEVIRENAAAIGQTGPALQATLDKAAAWEPSTVVGLNTEARANVVTSAAEQGAAGGVDEAAGYIAGGVSSTYEANLTGAAPTFPIESLRQIARNSVDDYEAIFSTIFNAEQRWTEANGTTETFPVRVAPGQPTPDRGYGGTAPGTQGPVTSVAGALDYIHTQMRPSEVTSLQEKLAAAGLYVDRDGQPVSFEKGDAYDPATAMAWRSLVGMSIQQNIPVETILATKISQRKAAIAEQQKALTKPNRDQFAAMLNGYFHDQLGRDLSGLEIAQLEGTVMKMKSDTLALTPGVDNAALAAVDPNVGYDPNALQTAATQLVGPELLSSRSRDLAQFAAAKYKRDPSMIDPQYADRQTGA